MTRTPAHAWAAALALLPLAASAAPELRVTPAWGGAVAAGRTTELRLELLAPVDTRGVVTAATPLGRVAQPIALTAD
ncbi:MAG: hypothetical protein AAGD86_07780, partial [Pseudomonadota bacterium]